MHRCEVAVVPGSTGSGYVEHEVDDSTGSVSVWVCEVGVCGATASGDKDPG